MVRTKLISRIVWSVLATVQVGSAAQQLSNIPRQDFWVTDGAVNAIAVTNDRVFIGGSFRYVGPYTGGGVPIDVNTMQPVAKYPKVIGQVYTAVGDGNGGWLIGGEFRSVGGRPRTNLAHITAMGELDLDWDAPTAGGTTQGRVTKVRLDENTLYVSGDFLSLGGQPRTYVGALDATTGVVKPWAPQVDSNVLALAVSPRAVYIGGKFRNVGESNRNYIAAIDKTTGQATEWDPNADVFPHGYVEGGFVTAITTYSNLVYVAGPVNGNFATLHLVAHDDSSRNAPWAIGKCDQVYDLLVHDSRLYVAGQFGAIGGDGVGGYVPRQNLAALDAATGQVLDWIPQNVAPGWVNTLALHNGRLYAAGQFVSPNPNPASGQVRTNADNIACFDLITGAELVRQPFNNGGFWCLATQGDQMFIGGEFDSLAGRQRTALVELDRRTGRPTTWAPSPSSLVTALAFVDDALVVGGAFTNIASQNRKFLAKFKLSDLSLTDWAPDVFGLVKVIHPTAQDLYVAGNLFQVNGAVRGKAARFDLVTGALEPWDPESNGAIHDLIEHEGMVYLAGEFTQLDGADRANLGSVSASDGSLSNWNPNPNGTVYDLELIGDHLFAAGSFTSIGGIGRTNFASFNLAAGAALRNWNMNASQSFPYWREASIARHQGAVIASGSFLSPPESEASTLSGFDPVTATAISWETRPWFWGEIRAMTAEGNTLFIGGDLFIKGRPSRNGFAVYEKPGFSVISSVDHSAMSGTHLRVAGGLGQTFIVERSDLASPWTGASTNTAWEGEFQVTLEPEGQPPLRAFRVRSQP